MFNYHCNEKTEEAFNKELQTNSTNIIDFDTKCIKHHIMLNNYTIWKIKP